DELLNPLLAPPFGTFAISYDLEVTDGSGNSAAATIFVNETEAPDPTFTITDVSCGQLNDGTISAVDADPTYTYVWSNNATGAELTNLLAGTYCVTITNTTGCTQDTCLVVRNSLENCVLFAGTVYLDADCIADGELAEDTPMEQVQVVVSAGGVEYAVYTQPDGTYELRVPPAVGNGINVIPPSSQFYACLLVDIFEPTMAGDTVPIDLWLGGVAACPALRTIISAVNTPQVCEVAEYLITVCNEGVVTADATDLSVTLGETLGFIAAQPGATGTVFNQVYWELPSLAVGACHTINLQTNVSCEAAEGQTHCLTASATATNDCDIFAGWTGAALTLTGSCTDEEVIFTLTNVGQSALNETLSYVVVEDAIAMFQPQEISLVLAPGAATSFSFPANGSTYTFQVPQVQNHPNAQLLSVSIEGCGTDDMNGFSTGFAPQFEQTTTLPSTDILCLASGENDATNRKSGSPIGYGTERYIFPGTELQYRIHFQNTGLDTVTNLLITDTLPEWLNVRSLRLGNSSHTFTATRSGTNVLHFNFTDIQLPGGQTAPEASRGFVDYFITPSVFAPLESLVESTSQFYFDNRPPRSTNTVFHTISRDFYEGFTVLNPPTAATRFTLSPNPTRAQLTLRLNDKTPTEVQVLVYNLQQQLVLRQSFRGTTHELSLDNLAAGVYSLRLVRSDGQWLGNARVVKQ
ncbi:MAG: T9SS type A sorting domain-containing protein, partial [Bacteroidota bacterium]